MAQGEISLVLFLAMSFDYDPKASATKAKKNKCDNIRLKGFHLKTQFKKGWPIDYMKIFVEYVSFK